MRKREGQSFYGDFCICSKPRATPAARPRRASESQPSSSDGKTQLTFFKSPKSSAHASGAWRHSHPAVTFFYLGFLLWHIWMTRPLRAREHLRSCLQLTNLCAKRKVLSLTKPKGKIYKTKFLDHYITSVLLSLNNKRTREPTYHQTTQYQTKKSFFAGFQATLEWEEMIEQTQQPNRLSLPTNTTSHTLV